MAKPKPKTVPLLLIFLLLAGCAFLYQWNERKSSAKKLFSRCINIGNALDAPRDMPWDVTMDNKYFQEIQEAGFDCVRLPVRFSDYIGEAPGYQLDPGFMQQIDGHIDEALRQGLVLILDLHHFTEIMDDPDKYSPHLLNIWKQLAERYAHYPPELVFELLNEPMNQLSGDVWNHLLAEAIQQIRQTNPNRMLVVGPGNYNSLDQLERLVLPKDRNLLVTFHFYEPNAFTFQGNPYHPGFEHLRDIEWNATNTELMELEQRLLIALQWSEVHHLPLFLGEFGANLDAPRESRIRWTRAVRELAEKHDMAWGYWELASGFGIFNPLTWEWDEPMLDALLNRNKQ